MTNNLLLNSDYYKFTHSILYPKDINIVYSYLESRGGKFNSTVFFGLQYLLKEYFTGQVVTQTKINEADEVSKNFSGYDYFNRAGWQYILEKHNGYLPIKIKAVPEGTEVDVSNILLSIENTDPNTAWLTNYLESILLSVLWYGTTVCTLSNQMRKTIDKYAKLTGGEVGPFHLNDFGFRGTSSPESAIIGGMAHLANFAGTDNVLAAKMSRGYYNAGPNVGMSVVAAEHSTVVADGPEKEKETYERMIDTVPDDAIISIVLDSYNYHYALDVIIGQLLRDKILARKGRFVARPDSSDPAEMVKFSLSSIAHRFNDIEKTSKGYKLLNPKVGIIYGDGINVDSLEGICQAIMQEGFAIDSRNVIFGCGGGLLQQCNRDTQRFAVKCSAVQRGGLWYDVFKDPRTQSDKKSKRGRMKLVDIGGKYATVALDHPGEDVMKTVFENGKLLIDESLDTIRQRIGFDFPTTL
jgi:nicotinamide phosphoribosyltransferase